MLYTTAQLYRSRADDGLEIWDRVGGGDSFASGLIYGFLAEKGPQWAVDCGAAHGALAMTTPGDTTMATPRRGGAGDEGRRGARAALSLRGPQEKTMDKKAVLERLTAIGVIPVIRAQSADEAAQAIAAIQAGGISVLEITMTVPGAVELIREVALRAQDALVGAGTVLDPETARACIAAGARFVVSPALNVQTIAACRDAGVAVLPGRAHADRGGHGVERGGGPREGLPRQRTGRGELHQVAEGPAAADRPRSDGWGQPARQQRTSSRRVRRPWVSARTSWISRRCGEERRS